MTKLNYLHLSVFYGCENRHGGVKRSDQIVEALSESNCISYSIVGSPLWSIKFTLKHPLIFLSIIFLSFYLSIFKGLSIKGFFNLMLRGTYPAYLIYKHKPSMVFYEVAPGFPIIFLQYLRWKKIKYIAIPHNIEFMVPGQSASGFRKLHYAFDCELNGYKAAYKVKVISFYDKSLLSCLGVNSTVFSYFPVKKDLQEFKRVRSLREKNAQENKYLALGSVVNKPTFDGVKKLLEYNNKYIKGINILVAGFGTERLLDYQSESSLIIGQVDSERLNELLVTSTALLINQPQTTGFLTKIIDFNLCGIPIFVLSEYEQAKMLSDYGVFCINIRDVGTIEVKKTINYFENPSLNDLF